MVATSSVSQVRGVNRLNGTKHHSRSADLVAVAPKHHSGTKASIAPTQRAAGMCREGWECRGIRWIRIHNPPATILSQCYRLSLPASLGSWAMTDKTRKMKIAGGNTSERKRNYPPTSSLSFMPVWLVKIPRAISRIAWLDELKSFQLNILEKAMPSLSHARFSMRIVRAGRPSPARRGQRSNI